MWEHGVTLNDHVYIKHTTQSFPNGQSYLLVHSAGSLCVRGSRRDSLFTPLLLLHFLPLNGKTEITLLKSMALQGQSFCVSASGKQEQQWLNGPPRDLQFHGLIHTDTAHYMDRVYRDQQRRVVRDTQHV